MSSSVTDKNENLSNKVIALFQFIKELNKLKSKAILNMEDYAWSFSLSMLEENPDYVHLYFRDRVDEEYSENDTDNVLLSVKKPSFSACPKPDRSFADWLNDGWNDYKEEATVVKSRQIINGTENDNQQPPIEPEYEFFTDDEKRVLQYNSWLGIRHEWVVHERKIKKIHRLFSDLYGLYFDLQRESETEELIVANGILRDKKDDNINHPVLTHRVNLKYDPDKDVVSIVDTESPCELYSVLFQSMQDVNLSSINQLRQKLQENDYHPLDRNETPEFLKILVHQLSADSTFADQGMPDTYKERLLIYCDPCFIARKRLDGTLKAIEQIIDNIQETEEIPAPIIDIVSGGTIKMPDDSEEESIEERLASVGGESVEVLLSKEANKEQLEIAKRIEYYNAVLVQGPPGTGKTHTIANLLGHFLAKGKSVLVTSYTSKALRVLKEKVPCGLQNLCVSVLDDSNVDMEKSIDGITSYMAKTTSSELKREMEFLAAEREDVISQLANVRRKIFKIINQECNSIVCNGCEISPSKAAQFVVEHSEDLSYIPGKVKTGTALPLSLEELSVLYKSNEELSLDDEKELTNDLPNPSEIISPDHFSEAWESLKHSEKQISLIQSDKAWKIDNNIQEKTISISGEFGELCIPYPNEDHIKDLKDYVASFGKIEPWMKAAAVDGKKGGASRQKWITLTEQIQKLNDFKETIIAEQFGKTILFSVSDEKESLRVPFEMIKKILTDKGKIGKLALMLHKDCAEALRKVSIDEHPVQTIEECNIILNTIEFEKLFKQCAVYWNELLSPHGVPKFEDLDTQNQERIALNWIPLILKYLDWYQNNYNPLVEKMTQSGIPSDTLFHLDPLDSEIVATEKILTVAEKAIPYICDACISVLRCEAQNAIINHSMNTLLTGKRGQSRICIDLYQAMCDGNISAYASCYVSLEKMFEKYELRKKRAEMLAIIKPVAPDWADAIKNHVGVHGSFTVPSNIEDAWKWKQLFEILEDIVSQPFSELQKESARLSKEYRTVTANYAEKSGWYHLLKRTESDIDMKQALQGWKLTVKKIGKGTGKQAPALKEEARKLMTKCQNAVPVWIMPINRALESLNPKSNRFDIIIIDEASQADISSLAILYMGKKLIIVGDDKQVSPMAVGVEVDKITALQQMYIKGKIPNSHLYNAKTSIYDIASTTFQPLMLREHFRCVPEIIGFSNMLSYDNKIKPLRDASSTTLLPAVVNYRVENGERLKRQKTNLNEAKAIVALIQSCLEQPEYDNKTFGVISLLGEEQAKEIQKLVEKEISAKDIINRKILCGNSAHFQGDERDVIFLSVVDSGEGNGPIHMQNFGSDDAYRKRYNVAASRAKDQLWVVHSLDSANDLKPGDIRKTLIDYANDPTAIEIAHQTIDQKAESPFESAVAKALSDKGYHLVQQWKVGAYRLDMVAVCGKKAVAIECDGERWHSSENQIRADMERQTILERLGWHFIRIRGSEYYRDPEATIDRVIEELSAHDIHPENKIEHIHSSRETDLLNRVKNRAAQIIQANNEETSFESKDITIAAALSSNLTENLPLHNPAFPTADYPASSLSDSAKNKHGSDGQPPLFDLPNL